MANEMMLLLSRKLYEKTFQDRINWRQAPFEDAYIARIAGADVFVKRDDYTHVEIRGSDDTIIDSLSTNDITVPPEDRSTMRSLFDLAKRKALGTDKVISSILLELDDDMPF